MYRELKNERKQTRAFADRIHAEHKAQKLLGRKDIREILSMPDKRKSLEKVFIVFNNEESYLHCLADYHATVTSAPALFSMGITTKADWGATTQFIGVPWTQQSACPWFRKSFTLSDSDVLKVAAGESTALFTLASVGYRYYPAFTV